MSLRDLFAAGEDALRRAVGVARLSAESAATPVGQTPRQAIWSLGRTTLYRYRGQAAPSRPPLLLVSGGRARMVQRRETYADIVARDVLLNGEQ